MADPRVSGPPGRRRKSFVLERNRRLSESLLWRLQRSFFENRGAQAWTAGVVPHYVTSNPWMADSYAKVVLGWLRDLRPELDPSQPVHIVELGCGSGRFAYHFLVRFFDLLSRSSLSEVPVRYVLTDFTDYNLDVLRSHSALQPFVEAGLLDFARFDVVTDEEIALSHSGEVLAAGTLANPLAVIANYVFDGIPQDCFTVRGGHLYESLVTLTSQQKEGDLDDPELLSRLELSWKHRPAQAGCYGDEHLDRIVAEYGASLDETSFVFPSVGLRCLGNLERLAGGRMLLLSADKGFSSEASLAGRSEPSLALHGSFSLMVNYHAIGRWFGHRGGVFLPCSHDSTVLNVSAAFLGEPAGGWVEVLVAFDDAIERRGPDAFFALKKGIEEHYAAFGLERLLAWLRLSGWDHNVFLGCLQVLSRRGRARTGSSVEAVTVAVQRIWESVLPAARDRRPRLPPRACCRRRSSAGKRRWASSSSRSGSTATRRRPRTTAPSASTSSVSTRPPWGGCAMPWRPTRLQRGRGAAPGDRGRGTMPDRPLKRPQPPAATVAQRPVAAHVQAAVRVAQAKPAPAPAGAPRAAHVQATIRVAQTKPAPIPPAAHSQAAVRAAQAKVLPRTPTAHVQRAVGAAQVQVATRPAPAKADSRRVAPHVQAAVRAAQAKLAGPPVTARAGHVEHLLGPLRSPAPGRRVEHQSSNGPGSSTTPTTTGATVTRGATARLRPRPHEAAASELAPSFGGRPGQEGPEQDECGCRRRFLVVVLVLFQRDECCRHRRRGGCHGLVVLLLRAVKAKGRKKPGGKKRATTKQEGDAGNFSAPENGWWTTHRPG